MKKYRLCDLVLDFDLYPRRQIDSYHTHAIADAIEAGIELPPIVIEKKSRRIIDGFHRQKAYIRIHGLEYEVEVVEKTYRNEGAAFLDAMRLNASHGRMLTQVDRVHCALRADDLKLKSDVVASALHMTADKIGELKANRVGNLVSIGNAARASKTALKRTISHMAGKTLTKEQAVVNDKLSGMDQLFYVNQITLLLQTELLDWSRKGLVDALHELHDLLGELLPAQAAE